MSRLNANNTPRNQSELLSVLFESTATNNAFLGTEEEKEESKIFKLGR